MLCCPIYNLVHFFFTDDFRDQKSATTILCAILHQLFLSKPLLPRDSLLDKVHTNGDKFINSFTIYGVRLLVLQPNTYIKGSSAVFTQAGSVSFQVCEEKRLTVLLVVFAA